MLDEFKKWAWFAVETAFVIPLVFWRSFWFEFHLQEMSRRIRETERLDVSANPYLGIDYVEALKNAYPEATDKL